MKTDVYDALFYLNQATSLEELTQTFEKIIREYGFDQYAIQFTTTETKKSNSQPNYLCNFASNWVDHYYSSKYYTIDPVILIGKESRRPYLWNRLWDNIKMSDKQIDFFNEAEEFGVAAGIGFPVPQLGNEPGIVSLVSSNCNTKEVTKILTENYLVFGLLSVTFHHVAEKLFEKKLHPDAPYLTPREKECLKWASIGKTDIEIAIILNISHRTVNMHMAHCYSKLNCTSRGQAIMKAIVYRIIEI